MNHRVRFFRWYRLLPILAMLFAGLASFGLVRVPGNLARKYLYPIEYREAILDSSSRHGVDPLLVCAVIKCESNWDETAVSDAGAVGLMQMMPSTSEELASWGLVDTYTYDPNNLTDPATNIEYGCTYLSQLQARLGSTDEVIAAYNAGPSSVEEWLAGGGDIADVIGFPETVLYLTRVKENYERYQQFYTETLRER